MPEKFDVCKYHDEFERRIASSEEDHKLILSIHSALYGSEEAVGILPALIGDKLSGKEGVIDKVESDHKFLSAVKRSVIYIVASLIAGGGIWIYSLLK